MLFNYAQPSVADSPKDHPFKISCEAGSSNRFAVQSDSVTVTIGQRVIRNRGPRPGIRSLCTQGKMTMVSSLSKYWCSIPIGRSHCASHVSGRDPRILPVWCLWDAASIT
jgi:hypothetical protein